MCMRLALTHGQALSIVNTLIAFMQIRTLKYKCLEIVCFLEWKYNCLCHLIFTAKQPFSFCSKNLQIFKGTSNTCSVPPLYELLNPG